MYQAAADRYDSQMPYRRCGRSGILLPEISLGFWHNFGDNDDLVEGRQIMRAAFDAGITHFDFANNYGPPYGSAERNCGQILKEDFSSYRDELIISTKAGHDMWPGPYGEWGSRKNLLASLDQSLARLQLDYVDIFYSHRPDPHTPLEETMGALATAVNSGRALYVGLSKYPLAMLKDAVEILTAMGVRTLIYQPPCSILRPWPIEEKILPWLHETGIGCIAFSPLQQGLLTDKYVDSIPPNSRAKGESSFLTEDMVRDSQPTLRDLKKIANSLGISLQHLALKWVNQQQGMTSTLIGARTVSQLEDSISSTQIPDLTEDTLDAINLVTQARANS